MSPDVLSLGERHRNSWFFLSFIRTFKKFRGFAIKMVLFLELRLSVQ